MYLNVRLHEETDRDLIEDIDRFTGNKKFTRSDRVKELMRIGKMMEERSMSVMLSTGRYVAPSPRVTPPVQEEVRKTTPPAKASQPLIKTPGWVKFYRSRQE